MLKISVYLMTAVIFTASVGVNVFKHICGGCHETYYTLDSSPSHQDECVNSEDCSCELHSLIHKEFSKHRDLDACADLSQQCDMNEHSHEYFHLDELYFSPSKIINPIIISTQIFSFNNNIEKEELCNNIDISLKEFVDSYRPDISILNCCFII